MFATVLVVQLPVGPNTQTIITGFDEMNLTVNEKYQQMYNFFKTVIESKLILNLMEESSIEPVNQIFVFEQKFFSNTFEDAQQFQNSKDFQEVLVQLYQSHNATVTVTTENTAEFIYDGSIKDGYTMTNTIDLIDIDCTYRMYNVQFPYSLPG